jgi:phytoene dehydrogenase-like protein
MAGEPHDVVIVGGGHNAVVAATYLARAGLDVVVLERLDHVGGAAVSVRPFDGHDARLSRFSYLVSLMPDALIDDLGLRLELRSRPTASYTPYEGGGLLVETDEGKATRASFHELTGSDTEFEAWQAFDRDVARMARAVAPTLLEPLPHIGDLRDQVDMVTWSDVVEEPLAVALERRFTHDLVRGIVGTDGLIGTFASLHDPSLTQNRCFLFHRLGNGGTGEWRVPVGGMGAVTAELERVAREAGADLRTGHTVEHLDVHADGVSITGRGFELVAEHVLSGVAPYVLAGLVGDPLPPRPSGSQFKVNLLVSRLPRLRSGHDPRVAFAGTVHVNEAMSQLEDLHAAASRGEPAFASGEIYCHTLTDRSVLGPELAETEAQTLTYFGLHTPYENLLDEAAGEAAYRQVLTSLEAYLDEPLEPLILGVEHKTPAQVEAELAMPGGNIFHGSIAWPWLEEGEKPHSPAERWGVETTHDRVLMCGSGARRGGNVSGISGHHAAHALLETIGR